MDIDTAERCRAHTVAVPEAQLRLRRRVVTAALADGSPLDRDALAAALAAHAERFGPSAPWTAVSLTELLWIGVVSWCDAHGVAHPDGARLRASLRTVVHHLGASGELPAGSDPPRVLRRVLDDLGGGRRRPRPGRGDDPRARHPAVGRRPVG